MAVKFNYKALGEPLVVDWPVAVSVPQDGGSVETQEFLARFKILTNAESKGLQDAALTQDGDPYAYINGFWVGLGKSEGETLTPELRAEMLSQPYIRQALLRAYVNCSHGQAAAKN